MQFGHLILQPSLPVLIVGILGVLGLVVWWLIRKRQKRVWLPTIRIMRLESRVLPRLVLRPPPFLPFLCFLVAAVVLAFFAMRPRTEVFTPFEPNQTRIHIFCDMSPSVSAHVSLEDYASRVSTLYQSLKEKGRVTLSTSHEPGIVEPESPEAVATLIKSRGFHRAGLRLGAAMKTLLELLGEADRLFVVSDKDQHSWTGFNWQYLLDEMDVVFFDLTGKGSDALSNVFINDARFLSSPSSPTMDWDVEIARRTSGGDLDGRLEVTYMGQSLGTFPWKLPAKKQRISARVEWPQTLIKEIDKSGARDVPLVFRIEVDGGDALTADNEFRTDMLGLKQDVLLVSDTDGERALEDPAEQLTVAMEILGFRLKRHDYLAQPGPDPEDYPFIVLLAGKGTNVDRFCPRSLELARLAEKAKQGAKDGRRRAMPKVWLAPATLDADYRALCQCYARLLMTSSPSDPEPAYCTNVEARSQWVGLLPSLGAKQVGGDMGDASKSLAWSSHDQTSGLDVLAFTVPLMPLQATGLNHAAMPILVKDLLTWQGLLDAKNGTGPSGTHWPRLEDLVTKLWNPEAVEPAEASRLRSTNVPLGESLLADIEEAQLPPRWTSQMDLGDKQLPAKKDREDPLPWLKLAAMIVVGVTAFEAFAGLGMRLGRFIGKKPEVAALLVFGLFGMFGTSGKAWARIEFNLVGYSDSSMMLATLSREVAHRTSIEFEPKPNFNANVGLDALGEPWLWIKDLNEVMGKDGRLRQDLTQWLKRGGFLILESPAPTTTLAQLTKGLEGEQGNEGWMPLPPDHELMRSFYLLDALPSCNGEIWRGFHYDGRLAILAVPYAFLDTLKDRGQPPPCQNAPDNERSVRVFVNLIMVALATDYKKDQIHLPEILKRLR